ncbi:AAA-like domain-containing protein [Baaleninema simplex]|uniref:AAA-like domain-containing protein n=1 Tax=Baaleninema simplex TaxID=2862350 RepID=UPI00034D935F|nr:AAA-like domain-containing protein [Baaleninema simplex]
MTIDEIVELVRAIGETMAPVQESVLRQAWQGATYTRMEADLGYDAHYLRNVASQLWRILSEVFDESISKANFRAILEPRSLTSQERLLLDELSDREAERPSPEYPGAPLPLQSPLYVERPPIETLTQLELHKPGCAIRIRGSRRMGKSSLLLRLLHSGRELGYATVTLDFQRAETEVLSDLNKLLRWFCANLKQQLGLSTPLNDIWDDDIGSKVSCTLYVQHGVLEALDRPLVLALQEVNRLFEFPEVAREFLPMLRSWHEEAKQVETWQKLRLVVVHSTEVYVPLDINQSPFNVGLPIVLPPFNLERVCELARRYGLTWHDDLPACQLVETVGGHPYLVSLALYHLRQGKKDLDRLLVEAPTFGGIYRNYLQELWQILQAQPMLLKALALVGRSPDGVELEPVLAYKLDSLGLVKLQGNAVVLSCQLYRYYFQERLRIYENSLLSVNSERSDPTQLDSPFNGLSVGDRPIALEREDRTLQQLCYIDELTQIPNRRYFDLRLDDAWQECRADSRPLAILSCDIDSFKAYNDTYGSVLGDLCLKQVALGIVGVTGDWMHERVVARYGGEEFVVLLSDTDAIAAVQIAREICQEIRMLRIQRGDRSNSGLGTITVSVGAASIVPDEQSEPEDLREAAEAALYESKRNGCDRVTLSPTHRAGWSAQETAARHNTGNGTDPHSDPAASNSSSAP